MTNFSVIILVLATVGIFCGAVKILSEVMTGRLQNKKDEKGWTITSLILALISCMSIEYIMCYYTVVSLLKILVTAFCIFSIYVGSSCVISLLKQHNDDYKELKDVYRVSNDVYRVSNDVYRVSNECTTANDGMARIDNCYSVNNAATTTVSERRRRRR